MMKLVSVNIGHVQELQIKDQVEKTGIFKLPASGPVKVTKLGLEQDVIVSKKHHGGPDDRECEQYEETIRRFGGINLQLLGIGRAGHVGFNEPLSALLSRTRVKALTPTTIGQNAPLFGGPGKVPRRAITMGVGTILEAQRLLLLATGAEKAEIMAKAVDGPITSMISATALQLHRPLHGGGGHRRRRPAAGSRLLSLGLCQRTRVGRIPGQVLKGRRDSVQGNAQRSTVRAN